MMEKLREQVMEKEKRGGWGSAPPAFDGRSSISPLYSALTGSIQVSPQAACYHPNERQGAQEQWRSVAQGPPDSFSPALLVKSILRSVPPLHPSDQFVKPRRTSR